MKKRGMVEEQFNWVFILIIGTVIILFFVKVVYNQKAIADKKLAIKVLNDFTILTVGGEVATSTASRIGIGGNAVSFDCQECSCKYYMKEFGKGMKNVDYNTRSLFAPSTVMADKDALMWAYDWNMPFKVTNFLYITSPDMEYIFVHGGGASPPQGLSDVISTLPDLIDNGLKGDSSFDATMTLSNYKYKGAYQVRIIVWDSGVYIAPSAADFVAKWGQVETLVKTGQLKDADFKSVSILWVHDIESTSGGSGTLEFYKLEKGTRNIVQDQDTTFYVGDASLIAAILVDNYYNYVCPMDSALMRLNHVSDVYIRRTEYLKSAYIANFGADDKCAITYDDALTYLDDIKTNSNVYFSGLTNSNNIININRAANQYTSSLYAMNEKITLFSCPDIY